MCAIAGRMATVGIADRISKVGKLTGQLVKFATSKVRSYPPEFTQGGKQG